MQLTIVKAGGEIVENAHYRSQFLTAFSAITGPKILVHGGGSLATKWAEKLGVPSQFINGRRVTSPEMLELITMIYSGINKQLVAALQQLSIRAFGISGADFSCIPATKRASVPVDFGFVGDPIEGTPFPQELIKLVQSGNCLVMSPLSFDRENGGLLNTNADTIALFLATAFQEMYSVNLVFAFGHPGVMRDLNDPASVFETLTSAETEILVKNGIIHTGMLPKLTAGFSALKNGVSEVRITRFDQLDGGTNLIL
jgi:acetylglutamate kinase